MSDDAAPPPAKKGGKMKKMLLIGVGALVLIGGGVGAGMYASGMGAGAEKKGPVEDPNMPKLVRKDGHDEEHPPKQDKQGEVKLDPDVYKVTYYVIEQNFTSNLRDSDGFVQIGLGVSTFYDQRVLDRLKEHEMAVRSAVLLALSDQDAFEITTPEGKDELRKELKTAINGVLKSKEGFGGIDDVYFTSFVIS